MVNRQLIQKCINGDTGSWDRLVGLCMPHVKRTIRYKLATMGEKNTSIVDDIAQEIFLSIWENDRIRGLRDPSRFRAWLVITTLNYTTNYCRKKAFRQNRGTLSLDKELTPEKDSSRSLLSLIPSRIENACELIQQKEFRRDLEERLSLFPSRQQLTLKLHLYHDRTQKEISRIMNIPLGTVATIMSRGKRKLACSLQKTLDK